MSSPCERTRHRYADVHKLVAAGWTISAIARRLNLDRKTVRRFRDTALDELLASARDRRPTGVLEPFKPYLTPASPRASARSAATDSSWRSANAATAAIARSSETPRCPPRRPYRTRTRRHPEPTQAPLPSSSATGAAFY